MMTAKQMKNKEMMLKQCSGMNLAWRFQSSSKTRKMGLKATLSKTLTLLRDFKSLGELSDKLSSFKLNSSEND